MAIDPPYRFDPFRNIINVHWGSEEETTGGTGAGEIVMEWDLMGSNWSSGSYNNNVYDIHAGTPDNYKYSNHGYSWSGAPAYSQIANYVLTNPEMWARAFASNATSGLYFAGNWESRSLGANEPHYVSVLENIGTYGIDLSGVTITYTSEGFPPVIYRANRLVPQSTGVGYESWVAAFLYLRN